MHFSEKVCIIMLDFAENLHLNAGFEREKSRFSFKNSEVINAQV